MYNFLGLLKCTIFEKFEVGKFFLMLLNKAPFVYQGCNYLIKTRYYIDIIIIVQFKIINN